MTTVVGIDPGMKGAISVFHEDGPITVHDLPVVNKMVDAKLLHLLISKIGPDYVALENVHSLPRDGHVGAFKFGTVFGVCLGVAAQYPIELVTPQTWKKHHGLLRKDKEASRQLALRKWPALAEDLKFKKNADRAEALLIADWFLARN